MRRRVFIICLSGAAAWPVVGRAQHTTMPVIGYLGIGSPEPFAPFVAAFHKGLGEAGYLEGKNIAVEYRWAEGRENRLPALAADLVRRKVDVIATSGGVLAALVAKRATATIPIIFETGTDPVSSGLVASFARPGGNLTGIAILTADLNPKRFELLSELVPQARVIAVLVNPKNLSADHVIAEVQKTGRARDVQVHVVKAGSQEQYEGAFSGAKAQAGAVLVANDPVFFSRREQLIALAARYAIPAIYEWREFAEAGGLASYGTSLAEMYRQKGAYVGRVLAGTRPSELPVQQPTNFQLVINLRTAKALGLTVPQSLLVRADEVIE